MKTTLEHYYGDIVRFLFLASGLLMIITLPIFQDLLHIPTLISVSAIAILGIAAGFTNPKQLISAAVNFTISIFGFVVFAYTAINHYQSNINNDKFLLTTIILAGIFLFAVYFSMKTLRSELLDRA